MASSTFTTPSQSGSGILRRMRNFLSSVAICSAFLSLVLRNQGLATVRAMVSVGREFVGTVYWELPIQQLPSALYLLSAETAGGRHQLVVNEKLVL